MLLKSENVVNFIDDWGRLWRRKGFSFSSCQNNRQH